MALAVVCDICFPFLGELMPGDASIDGGGAFAFTRILVVLRLGTGSDITTLIVQAIVVAMIGLLGRVVQDVENQAMHVRVAVTVYNGISRLGIPGATIALIDVPSQGPSTVVVTGDSLVILIINEGYETLIFGFAGDQSDFSHLWPLCVFRCGPQGIYLVPKANPQKSGIVGVVVRASGPGSVPEESANMDLPNLPSCTGVS